MPKVSVIIPTYNRRALVLETLESVFCQTFKDFEVIVVNDGSPDDTGRLLQPLDAAGKIRYFEQPNTGLGAARNKGMREAQGEYLAFLDDDDLWPSDKLEWQVRVLDDAPALLMVAGVSAFFEVTPPEVDPGTRGSRPLGFQVFFQGNPINSIGQTLIRASALADADGFDEQVSGVEDLDLWIRLSQSGSVQMWTRVALFYRRHPGAMSSDGRCMLRNCDVVFRRHLARVSAPERGILKRQAYLWLYKYLGSPLLKAVKRDLKRGKLLRAWSGVCLLGKVFLRVPFNLALARRVRQDFLEQLKRGSV